MSRRNFRATELAAARRPRRRRTAGPLTVVRADPRVMRAALRIAGGDAGCVQIQHDGSVIVRNRGRGGRERHEQPA